jgi:hypothetical protein
MLTTSELYDLVKAKKLPTRLGKKGGHYYETQQGKRVYVGHADAVVNQQVAHILALTPHSGTSQGPAGPVEVPVLEAKDQRKLALASLRRKRVRQPAAQRQVMHVASPKGLMAQRASKQHIHAQIERWPAFICRNCGTSVVPHFGVPQVEGLKVSSDPETGAMKVEETGGKIQKVNEVLKVHITKPGGEAEVVEGYDPEMAAKKMCPECGKPAEKISSEIVLRDPGSKVKVTKEDRAASRARVKESREQEKRLKVALAKTQGKRTPEEQKLVDAHEARAAVGGRIAEDKRKAEQRQSSRKIREDAKIAAEENEALDVMRQKFREHLATQGVTTDEAEQRSQQATVQELAAFAHQLVRDEADRAEATRRQLSEESQGKRIPAVISVPEIAAHLQLRRQGLPEGENRAVFRETLLHHLTLRQEAEKRTERLRERLSNRGKMIREQEEARLASEKDTKKSLNLWIRI